METILNKIITDEPVPDPISSDKFKEDFNDLSFFGTRDIHNNDKQLLNYYWFHQGFTESECQRIISLAQKKYEQKGGTTFGAGGEYRKSTVRWLPPSLSTEWIYQKLKGFVKEANGIFSLDLTGFTEYLQFTEYEGVGAKYGYHVDVGPNNWHRKLSIVVQLTRPEEYTGGDLNISTGGNVMTAPKDIGNVILFPSFLQHEVLPLESGNRYSLVSWVSGPPWR